MTVITKLDQSASWDAITNTSGFPGLINPPTTLQGQTIVPSGSPSDLTYYVSFTTSDGIPVTGETQDQTFGANSTLYQLTSFSFDVQNTTSIGSATSGAGAGKVTFNPLNLVLSQPSLMPTLFQQVASGGHFTSVDVLGYRQDGTLATDDAFNLVAPTDFSTDNTGLTSLALEYGGLKITTTPPAGTTGSPITGGWNIITNSSDSAVAAASPAVALADAAPTPPQGQTISPAVNPDLTYYVRFTENPVVQGESTDGPLDGSTLYQLNSFSFDIHNTSTSAVRRAGPAPARPPSIRWTWFSTNHS